MKTWNPHPYQVSAAQHALYNPGAGLFLRPGLGKTSVTLATCQILKQEKIIKATLVIAPLRVAHSVWPAEIAKWSNFKDMTVSVCIGNPRQREDALKVRADIYTINFENVEWLFNYLADKPWPFDNLVIDESTKFKNPQGVRFKALKKVIDKFKRVLILTGTPAGNGLEDLFGQINLVDGGQRLGQFITHFRKTFFNSELIRIGGGQFITKWHPRRDTAERIKDKISDICLYMSDTDYLTMPELTFNTINVSLSLPVMKGYRKLEDALHLAWGSAKINAATASAAGIKLRQYVGGTVYGDEGVVTIHTEKLDALAKYLEQEPCPNPKVQASPSSAGSKPRRRKSSPPGPTRKK